VMLWCGGGGGGVGGVVVWVGGSGVDAAGVEPAVLRVPPKLQHQIKADRRGRFIYS